MLTLLALSSLAAAEVPPIDLLVGSRAPLDVGARARVELPDRSRLGLGLGYLPGPYVGLINGAAVGLGAYDDATAEVIEGAISRALVVSLDLAWRPLEQSGFSVGVGYSLASLGGDTTPSQVLAVASDQALPRTARAAGGADFELGTTLHTIRPELGWTFLFEDRLVLDAGLGGLFTLGTRASVQPAESPGGVDLYGPFTARAEDWLVETLDTYAHTPTLSVAVGVRLGGADGGW